MIPRPPRGREEAPVQISRLLEAHELILKEARTMAKQAVDAGDDGTNDLLVSDVIRTNELQAWFVPSTLLMCRSSARLAEAEPTGNRHRQAHNSIFVPRTPRNLASQAGCAGQAGAVTKLASTTASVIPMSANVPPALVTSGPTAG